MRRLFWLVLALATGITLAHFNSAACSCVEPRPGLVAWWPGDGNLNDIIGGNSGIQFGNITFADGYVGRAFKLDGTGFIAIPDAPSLTFTKVMTAEAWFLLDAATAPSGVIIAKGDQSWSLQRNPLDPDTLVFGTNPGEDNPTDTLIGNRKVNDGQWHHAAVVLDGATKYLYVDGVLDASTPWAEPLVQTIAPVWIGTNSDFLDSLWKGFIDEVTIYNRALSPEEIAAIFNAGGSGKCKTPRNLPPVAKCKDVTVSAGPSCFARASINDGSYDPDGDPISFTQSPAGPYSLGDTSVSLTVTDSHGAARSCTATVTVVDKSPPTITRVIATPAVLWPPNHKMVPVRITIGASDNCGGTPQCRIVSVTSNEPVNGLGDGDTAPDWQVFPGSFLVNLRAERSGQGSGRIYTVDVQCSDGDGNISPASTVQIRVPHDPKVPREQGESIRRKNRSTR